jgi:hypothetical protein
MMFNPTVYQRQGGTRGKGHSALGNSVLNSPINILGSGTHVSTEQMSQVIQERI